MNWNLRHEYDRAIVRGVYEEDEYRLPARMGGWRVIDVGAHLGAFSRLCAERGAAVTAFEPDPDNFALLGRNVAGLDVACVNAAVMGAAGRATLWRWPDPCAHTLVDGCGLMGPEVEVLGVGDALSESGGADLVKIDAEGAEYSIIPATEFPGVERLIVEFHQVGGGPARAEGCRKRLASLGFRETRFERVHENSGLWFAIYAGER